MTESPRDEAGEVSTVMRKASAKLNRQLRRTNALVTSLQLKKDVAEKLRSNARKRNASSLQEIASAPNFLLIASMGLFGTVACWILGDMVHWTVGIVCGLLGLIASVVICLRFTFNATLFSDAQLERTGEAAVRKIESLAEEVRRLELELAKAKPLVDAEIEFERDYRSLLKQKNDEDERLRKEAALRERMAKELRSSGNRPSQKQLKFAKHLGVRVFGHESSEEVSFMLQQKVNSQTPEEKFEGIRRWKMAEAKEAKNRIRSACLREIESGLKNNQSMGEEFTKGFVVIRGEECGREFHGKFIPISVAEKGEADLPPFNDCDPMECECEIAEVVEGETAKEVFRYWTT